MYNDLVASPGPGWPRSQCRTRCGSTWLGGPRRWWNYPRPRRWCRSPRLPRLSFGRGGHRAWPARWRPPCSGLWEGREILVIGTVVASGPAFLRHRVTIQDSFTPLIQTKNIEMIALPKFICNLSSAFMMKPFNFIRLTIC